MQREQIVLQNESCLGAKYPATNGKIASSWLRPADEVHIKSVETAT